MRRPFIFFLPFVLSIIANTWALTDRNKPNIIFILADDLGYGDLGCYGQQQIKTPRLDRMAAEGLRFTDAYAGGAVCAPSRCVLMTGLHVGHARVRGNTAATDAGAALLAEDVTIADVLKDAGYSTALIGKWGLGEPTNNAQGLPRRQGFDYFFGYLKQGHAHNYYPDHLWRNESKVTLPNVISGDPALKNNVAEKKVQYSHDLFAEEALSFVREHKDKPFFLYLAFTIPHANNEAGDRGMEVPDYGQYDARDWPEPQKGHAAMISRMDADVGRLLDLLRELQLERDTLVVFSSDNGPHHEGAADPDFNNSNGTLRGYKGGVTEGGIRVPFIAWWPGRIPAGRVCDSPVYFADMMPTLAAFGGGAPTPGDGIDLTPTFDGKQQPELFDRFLYWEFDKDGVIAQAARWNKWKAIRDRGKQLQLYDLSSDIGEAHDVAGQHAKIVTKFDEYLNLARTDSPHWPWIPTANQQAKAGAAGGS
jgi:arylsulfatase A-like enzyme